ncbi:MAG: hypothetical protein GC134_05400 [Proteobacteria bacterium]|nr:hypothetical protein [Pseudomonadota bacterium]
MELLSLLGHNGQKTHISDDWHKAYGISHLIARLTLKRTEHHALASMEADTKDAQLRLSMEIAALKAEITEWLIKRPMPDGSWIDPPALHPSLVTQLSSLDVDDRQLPAKATLIVRDYWFGVVVPRLANDEPVLNGSTFRKMCDELVAEAKAARKRRATKLVRLVK